MYITQEVYQTKPQQYFDDVLKAVREFNLSDLNRFMALVGKIQARRKEIRESELLVKINQFISADVRKSYEYLIAKRETGVLTDKEHQEFLRLIDVVEMANVKRIETMVELSDLREVSLIQLMKDLDQVGKMV